MSIDLRYPSYFVTGVVLYYVLLFGLAAWHRRPKRRSDPGGPVFLIFVPALNEQEVIAGTVRSLLRLRYPRFAVLVADDASSDRTWTILQEFADNARVMLFRRELPDARRGKSDVLNACYTETRRLLAGGHPLLGGADPSRVVVGITDADGRLDVDALEVVAGYFDDRRVASVQIGVRIANASTNLLTRMQDMEFVGFSAFVQKARDHFGSSGLGGNGQFTRLSALDEIAALRGAPWRPDALTEDLELGLALVCNGWKTRFCPDVFVAQQGLPSWRPLFRQRTRWIQGHYSCWSYVPKLAIKRRISFLTRLDLIAYLLLVVTVGVVSFELVAGVLDAFGVIRITAGYAPFAERPFLGGLANLFFSLAPLVLFMTVYQRRAERPFRWWEVPAAGVVFTMYTYIWMLATVRSLARLAARRNDWVKTPRVLASASTTVEQAVP